MFWNTNKKILEEVKTLNLRLEFLTMAFLASNGNNVDYPLEKTKQKKDADEYAKGIKDTKKDFEYMDSNTSIEEDIKRVREQELVNKEKDFFEYNDDSGIGIKEELIEDDDDKINPKNIGEKSFLSYLRAEHK